MKDKTLTGGIILLILGVAVGGLLLMMMRQPTPTSDLPPAIPAKTSLTPTGRARLFKIVPEASEARFKLGEILRGEPKEVVGVTSLVSGEIAVDYADLSTTQVSTIVIDARDLTTDNSFRNRAIHNYILLSSAYPEITFTPTTVDGLPETAVIGQPLTFTITGQLTITIFSNEETFTVTAVPVSETRIEGTATTTIQRANYELAIPSATGVASVDEAITLEFDFVAEQSE
ncbi:MAG: hypothetical protein Kow0080_21240 [Candidatus Promineifilaceae bacterium]